MIVIGAAEVEQRLSWPELVGALDAMFRGGCAAPPRHHHPFDIPGESAGTLLLMPAWVPGAYLGVKMVSVVPDNGSRALPAIAGTYILASALTGETLAIIDGACLTAWRTAAASALASQYLSRQDSANLLVVGTGALSARLAAAHASVRPIRRIAVWGRDRQKAGEAAARIRADGLDAEPVVDLEAAVRSADIVSCATLSREPLVRGAWLQPGAHLDLVGAFNPGMRESDDAAVLRSQIFVDTREGALHEAGDLVQPIRAGLIGPDAIAADLRELCLGLHPGRRSADEVTLFKSVGASLEDLAAAVLVYEKHRAEQAR
ncbi:ornithine cyclodeaminase [Aureimonas sp. SA4125]|uniref:ornithine cyclodeaminase family protein n=1 Tax=Aureimonas sp. SA4125 TaxID=2826993 RepID=UPI001CC58925|nr:ornithine cyclodeaminase family protein [Aureimonas sp. SA4125]BDA84369.1 ornithine cyclodeaminase [Aureimonas sp. SA4125]